MATSDQPPQLPKVLSALELLTEDELVQLNHIVVERLRLMRQIKAHGKMMNFRIGQRVRFAAAGGELIRGMLTRHNRKSVTIVTANGHQWRVSPDLVQDDSSAHG